MRVYVAEIPKDYDHINHLGLRSALENEDIIPCYLTIGPGDIIAEDEDGSNGVVFNYKYHSMMEYQQDCEILRLTRPKLDKSKIIVLGNPKMGNTACIEALEMLKEMGKDAIIASDTHYDTSLSAMASQRVIDTTDLLNKKFSERKELIDVKDGKAKRRERRKNNK